TRRISAGRGSSPGAPASPFAPGGSNDAAPALRLEDVDGDDHGRLVARVLSPVQGVLSLGPAVALVMLRDRAPLAMLDQGALEDIGDRGPSLVAVEGDDAARFKRHDAQAQLAAGHAVDFLAEVEGGGRAELHPFALGLLRL